MAVTPSYFSLVCGRFFDDIFFLQILTMSGACFLFLKEQVVSLMYDYLQLTLSWLEVHFSWWVVIGFAGQFLFMMRFVTQWVASERARKSVMPEIFWYFSLGGGLILFIYACHQKDPVFILGQGLGLFIYLRNIYFIWFNKQPAAKE